MSEHIAGLILARGGSTEIPRKNARCIAGYPLITWVLRPMIDCKKFSSVWVSTDDDEIAKIAKEYGANIHYRSSETSSDSSSSLMAVQEFIKFHSEISVVALVQCTSPCLKPSLLEIACDKILHESYDSVFSVRREHMLRWKEVTPDMITEPLNFDPYARPRRQDWKGELVESGHFYFCRVSLIKEGLLQGKRCCYIEFPKELCIEIDTEIDWLLAEQLLKIHGYQNRKCAS